MIVLLAVLPATVWGQLPAGSEFQVNAYTTGLQWFAAVASDANGNFVVVWDSYQDGSDQGVVGQRFSAAGVPQGSEFQINSYTTARQIFASVAADANGNFVVVWGSNLQDGHNFGVFGQRFSAMGAPRGGEFRVNTYTTSTQARPSVSSDASGNFVVVWESGQDGDGFGVFGQRFNAAGVPQGSEFQVNAYTTSFQGGAKVAADASGNFVVIWQGYAQDGSSYGVFGRYFDASGIPQTGEFRVNSYTTGIQYHPGVAWDTNGTFVVVWESDGQDGSSLGVFGRRVSTLGVPQASEFQVNSYTSSPQYRPVVAADASGNFVVAWASYGQDGNSGGIFGQLFSASGVPQGNEFKVNTYTTGLERIPALAADSDGDFVVVWQNDTNQDGSSAGVFGQRYGDLIFQDGFESGGVSRWSSASTGGLDLSVSGAGAMAGTLAGLQAFVNDTSSLFVQDDTPSAESRYRVRFYFDPNGFDPGESQSHFRTRILIAFDPSGLRVITLVLKRQLGAYTVEARVKRNDGTRADTGFFPITDAPHFIEFDWRQATGPGASDGSLEFWIDDVSVATLTGIDNDQSPVDFVRMGALSIKTGAAGTPYYDQFESRRQRLIGPE